jgi:hypothetical protein
MKTNWKLLLGLWLIIVGFGTITGRVLLQERRIEAMQRELTIQKLDLEMYRRDCSRRQDYWWTNFTVTISNWGVSPADIGEGRR